MKKAIVVGAGLAGSYMAYVLGPPCPKRLFPGHGRRRSSANPVPECWEPRIWSLTASWETDVLFAMPGEAVRSCWNWTTNWATVD